MSGPAPAAGAGQQPQPQRRTASSQPPTPQAGQAAAAAAAARPGGPNGVPRAASSGGQPIRPQHPNGPQGRPAPAAAPSAAASAAAANGLSARRGSPSPTPPLRSSSSSTSLSSMSERVIEMEDDIPLVAEVFENQRWIPMKGWGTHLLDRPAWSNEEGTEAKSMDDFKVPPGWTWGGEWQCEINEEAGPKGTDAEGWSYAPEFSRHYRGSGEPVRGGVRRRRHFRRRVPPAKSVKTALGLGGTLSGNSLTVGYLKNPLAVASNTVRANATLAAANQNSMRGAAGAKPRPAGALSLAELYAKQTVDAPPTAPVAAAAAASSPDSGSSASAPPLSITTSDANASPSPSSSPSNGGDANTTGVDTVGPLSSTSASSAGSGSPSLHSNATTPNLGPGPPGRRHGRNLSMINGPETPWSRPKFTPFASMAEGGATGPGPFSSKLEKSMVKLWEFQRYWPVVGWKSNMLPTDKGGIKGGWINEGDGKRCESKENFSLTPDWRWNMDNWQCMIDSSTDVDGWSYAIEQSRQFHSKKSMEHFVRRRLWQREKIQKPTHLGEGGRGDAAGAARKSYNILLERLELLKQDLKNEEGNDDHVAMDSATW